MEELRGLIDKKVKELTNSSASFVHSMDGAFAEQLRQAPEHVVGAAPSMEEASAQRLQMGWSPAAHQGQEPFRDHWIYSSGQGSGEMPAASVEAHQSGSLPMWNQWYGGLPPVWPHQTNVQGQTASSQEASPVWPWPHGWDKPAMQQPAVVHNEAAMWQLPDGASGPAEGARTSWPTSQQFSASVFTQESDQPGDWSSPPAYHPESLGLGSSGRDHPPQHSDYVGEDPGPFHQEGLMAHQQSCGHDVQGEEWRTWWSSAYFQNGGWTSREPRAAQQSFFSEEHASHEAARCEGRGNEDVEPHSAWPDVAAAQSYHSNQSEDGSNGLLQSEPLPARHEGSFPKGDRGCRSFEGAAPGWAHSSGGNSRGQVPAGRSVPSLRRRNEGNSLGSGDASRGIERLTYRAFYGRPRPPPPAAADARKNAEIGAADDLNGAARRAHPFLRGSSAMNGSCAPERRFDRRSSRLNLPAPRLSARAAARAFGQSARPAWPRSRSRDATPPVIRTRCWEAASRERPSRSLSGSITPPLKRQASGASRKEIQEEM